MKKIQAVIVVLSLCSNLSADVVYNLRVKHVEDKNYTQDIPQLEKIATADAYNLLGEIYYFGLGVNKDFARARAYFEKASSLGHPAAPSHLARMSINGEGVKSSIGQAVDYYALAASRGYPGAAENKAAWEARKEIMTQRKSQELINNLSMSSDSETLNFLGESYHFGYGVAVDFDKARHFYELAVALRNPIAANHLGRMYTQGEGVKKDPKKAKEFYEIEQKYQCLY